MSVAVQVKVVGEAGMKVCSQSSMGHVEPHIVWCSLLGYRGTGGGEGNIWSERWAGADH